MANPNRTVAAARKVAAMVCVDERPFGNDRIGAESFCDEQRRAGKNARVRSHKIGPKRAPSVQYRVCIYERA